jgi:hypothetical protein
MMARLINYGDFQAGKKIPRKASRPELFAFQNAMGRGGGSHSQHPENSERQNRQ